MLRNKHIPDTSMALVAGIAVLVCAPAFSAPLAVGQPAPAFSLPDQGSVMHTTDSLRGHTSVLAFYPADFSKGCTTEAHNLTRWLPAFKKRGIGVYGVSVQDAKSHAQFCDAEKISYPLLADVGGGAARAFGVYNPERSVAQRATFVIGPDGRIVYEDTSVKVNEHGAALIAAVDGLAAVDASLEQTAKPSATRPFPLAPAAGDPAPPFTLPVSAPPTGTADSRTSVAFEGGAKPAVLMFLSTRCPTSVAYAQRLQSLATDFAPKGIDFIAIDSNADERPVQMKNFGARSYFPFPILRDAGNHVADAYGALVTPETFLIDSDGIIRYHGRIDDDQDPSYVSIHDLRLAIEALLASKPIPKAEAPAAGCDIKRVKPIATN